MLPAANFSDAVRRGNRASPFSPDGGNNTLATGKTPLKKGPRFEPKLHQKEQKADMG